MRALILVVASLLLAVPLGTVAAHYAPAGNLNCEPEDEFHVYLRAGGTVIKSSLIEHPSGAVHAGDGNLEDCPASTGRPGAGDGMPLDFDGDPEYGIGGAAHPVVSGHWGDRAAACGWASSHHDSTFTVADHIGATVAFVVAADNTQIDEDPSTPQIDGCTTDGLITRLADPYGRTDANDCFSSAAVTPAIPGIPSSGTCAGGWDGLTWVIVLTGVVEIGGTVILSTPTDGDTF